MELDYNDLRFAIIRLPSNLRAIMQEPEWQNRIFVGGGYLRSIVSGEPISDVDVFVQSTADAELLAYKLCNEKKDIYKTDNAYTIKGKVPIQIIYRWVFEKPESVGDSFDFTVCCAVIFHESFLPAKMNSLSEEPKRVVRWRSFCDERFYIDLASKRLVYRNPIRNEDAGGSMLRVLKFYQRGYRIPLDSLGGVIARLIHNLDVNRVPLNDEIGVANIITGLLREVDPAVDPTHLSHLPSTKEDDIKPENI
jgi:hypothetical protein